MFCVGDRVVSLKNFPGVKVGETGTIQHISGDGTGICSMYVRWDEYRPGRHNNSGLCEMGHGWMVSYDDIEHEMVYDLGDLPNEVDANIDGLLFNF